MTTDHRLLMGLLLGLCLFAAGPAFGLTFNVNTTADTVDANTGDGVCQDAGGNCSLRAAIMQSNVSSGADTINVPAGTYALTIGSASSDLDESIGDLDIESGGVSIIGAGSASTTIDASSISHRVFQASVDSFFSGSISFQGLTLQGGNTSGFGTFNRGAAVDVGSRFATLVSFSDVIITSNTGASAVSSRADLTFTNSVVSNNTGNGISLTNDSAQITGNVKELNMTGSTVEGNTGTGIAIGNCDGGTLTNSTVSGNGVHGLSIQFTNNKNFTLTNATIANNGTDGVAGIGFTLIDPIFGNTPVRPNILVRNTIIADNTRSDVTTPALDAESAVPSSQGFNIVSDNSAASNFNQTGDMNSTDPQLVAIALNAPGTTRTHALSGTSPAIDNASASFAPAADQRGVTRPQGAGDDIGAYEFMPTSSDLSVSKTADVTMAAQGDPIEFTIVVGNAGPDPVSAATVSDVLGSDFSNASWTCAATPPSTCTASGSGDIADTVNIDNGGSITYTLNVNLSLTAGGMATNTASVGVPSGASDPNAGNNSDSVNIDIPNTPPVANADSYTVLEDTPLVANDADGTTTGGDASDDGVLANDTDIDVDPLTATTAGTFTATGIGGSVTLAGDGTFTYTPPADASGTDSFTYTVSDGAATDQATVTLTVSAVNDPPSFVPGPDQSFDGGTSGAQSIAGWATGFDPGPNEGGQSVLDYLVGVDSDPSGVLNSADVTNAGSLELDLTGNAGTAALSVQVRDDGGTANGGQDTSASQTVYVTVGTNANLRVVVSQCSSRSGPGFSHDYAAAVFNRGPDAANAIVLNLDLPVDSTFLSADPTAPDCVHAGGTVTCDVGSLAAFASTTVVVRFSFGMSTFGDLPGSAEIAAVEPDLQISDNTFTVTTEVIETMVSIDGFESCDGM